MALLLIAVGAAKSGLLFVPLNSDLTKTELSYRLKHTKASVIASQPQQEDRVRELIQGFGGSLRILPLKDIGLGASDVSAVIAKVGDYAGDRWS